MVAQTKSTARPMTSGELAVADVPPDTKGTSAMAADSTAEASWAPDAREEGEIDSGGGEDILNVVTSVDKLVSPKDFCPPILVFGKSLVTFELIK